MEDFGSDFITITDEDGVEYELEILGQVEYQGKIYLAVIPATEEEDLEELEVSILRSDEEDGESILCAVTEEEEMEAVYQLVMDQLYEEDEEEE